MNSYRRLVALRRVANQQVDQRRYDALHCEANEAWQDWLALQIAAGLPRYSPDGRRLQWEFPPEQGRLNLDA